jgi:23S rRNA (uridine2552-2'-O)-methyltransferase
VPNEWLRKRKKDHFHNLAKDRGYRSRAAFKLKQINQKYHFIRRGDSVLDLGAAPGGWLQAVHQIVGGKGYVLGLDKQPIDRLPFENVETAVIDLTDKDTLTAVRSICRLKKFDAVTSDLAQNVSGVWEVDHARQINLARCALSIARGVLKNSGNLLVKVFQGPELSDFKNEMKSHFRILRIVKPPASRSESAELYFLGLSFRDQLGEFRSDNSVRSVCSEPV